MAEPIGERQITVTEVRRPIPIRLIVALIVLALLALFIWRNDDEATVDFVVFDVTTAVAWVILISVVLGLLIGLVVMRFRR